jgi:hypothetical protein
MKNFIISISILLTAYTTSAQTDTTKIEQYFFCHSCVREAAEESGEIMQLPRICLNHGLRGFMDFTETPSFNPFLLIRDSDNSSESNFY